ncbi:MAG: hypothetical protein EXR68_06870 [Dehalococcoidia bacterium]|nr:hypothetical protein [Dehalococcoidia bacterium]
MPYEPHPVFDTPDRSALIWRYMSLVKLLDLLTSKGLVFARCDRLGDPHEGTVSHENITIERTNLGPDVAAARSRARSQWRRHVAVNCWHLGRDESAAMWALYGLNEEGIAVRTPIGRLMDSLKGSLPVYIGAVRYRDYAAPVTTTNTFGPFLYKRRNFEHKHEVRAMFGRIPIAGANGMGLAAETFLENEERVNIDLPTLVDAIFASSGSPDWVREAIEQVLHRFRLDITVHSSAIDDPAIF